MAQSARNAKVETRTSRLKLTKGKRYYTKIGEGLMLVYRRTAAGYGTWSAKILRPSGEYELRALGEADDQQESNGADVLTFYEAQQKARDVAKAEKIGAGIGRRGPLTLRQAIERYAENRESRKHADSDRTRLVGRLSESLLDTAVNDLAKSTLENWRNGLVAKGDGETVRRSKDSANRVLTVLKSSLNHAFEDDKNAIPTDKPWRTVKAFKDVGASRQDHFAESEVLTLIDKAREQDPAFADFIEAAFHTGARPPGELSVLDVRHFDAKNAQITIPSGKTGARVTTLTQEGVTFFTRMADGKKPRDILVPRANGERWGKSEQHRPMKAALAAAGLPSSASAYSIRHTYISRAIERGMPLNLIAENVGTSVRMIEQNYGKFIAQKRRELIEKYAPVLRVIEGGKETLQDIKSAKRRRKEVSAVGS